MAWVAQKVISSTREQEGWVVIDDVTYVPHPVAAEFYLYLRGGNRSPNTARAYMSAIARFLTWCDSTGVRWESARLGELARYKLSLEQSPTRLGGQRSPRSVSVALTAMTEFLRFAAGQGHADHAVAEQLTVRRHLTYLPKGFDPGEAGQFRTVRARVLKVASVEDRPEVLTHDEIRALLGAAATARDRFVICCLHATGLRIGELLGMRRGEVHFLPDSTGLGCRVRGAHLHVPPRRQSPNQARSKSGGRIVPVEAPVVEAFRDYAAERFETLDDDGCDFVLVNLTGATVGGPMTYSNIIQLMTRLGARTGVRVTPHMFRHTAATNWLAAGVPRDVVQTLLGHASAASLSVYTHPSDAALREAVTRVHEGRRP